MWTHKKISLYNHNLFKNCQQVWELRILCGFSVECSRCHTLPLLLCSASPSTAPTNRTGRVGLEGATYSEWENGRKLMPISHFFSLAPANAATPRELVYLQGFHVNNHHIWLIRYDYLTIMLHKKVGSTILTIDAILSRNIALQSARDHGLWCTCSWFAASSFALRRGRECRE